MPDTELEKVKPPKPGESTEAQNTAMVGVGATGMGLSVCGGRPFGVSTPLLFGGGTLDNPLGYPGYGSPYYGTYSNYRLILRNPAVRLARAVVVAALQASTWFFEADEDVDPKITARIEKTYSALRAAYVRDAIRSLDYGWAGWEVIWELEDQYWCPCRLKPLLADATEILIDVHGNFTGLRPNSSPVNAIYGVSPQPQPAQPGDLLVAKHKALIVTHDGEAGNLYGRSRLENIRDTAWKEWLDNAQQLQAIGGKLSGRSAVIKCPVGTYTDSDGNERAFTADAVVAGEAFRSGQIVILPNLALEAEDPDIQAKLAGSALVTFDVIDFGELSGSIGGLLERQRHAEELIFMGYLRSPRTGLESQNGSRADAQQHTDTGTADTQQIGEDFCEPIQRLINAELAFNDGLKPNKVRVKQSPLEDNRQTTFKELITAVITDPNIRNTLVKVIDMDKVVDGLDVPRDGDWDEVAKQVEAEAKKAAADQMKHEASLKVPPGQPAQPKPNGNPRLPAPAKGEN